MTRLYLCICIIDTSSGTDVPKLRKSMGQDQAGVYEKSEFEEIDGVLVRKAQQRKVKSKGDVEGQPDGELHS